MSRLLIVRGDETGVPFSSFAFGYCLGRREGLLLIEPSSAELQETLVEADGFFYYGHGDETGALHLSRVERFTQADLASVIARRKDRMEVAEVRACYSGSRAEYVNRWLELAKVVHCFPNVTASPAPPFIHPMHTYREPISRDPGRGGFWSRFRYVSERSNTSSV